MQGFSALFKDRQQGKHFVSFYPVSEKFLFLDLFLGSISGAVDWK